MRKLLFFLPLLPFLLGASNPECVKIDLPIFPTVNIIADSVDCFGGSDGSATAILNTVGAIPSTYSYSWNTGETTVSILGKPAGVYGVTVTQNATGYTFSDLVVIHQPNQIFVTYVPTHVNCFGLSTGAINVSVNGGTPPFSYSWSEQSAGPLSFTTQDLTNIPTGTYTVGVTDAKGCTGSAIIVINQPASSLNSSVTGTHVSCAFGSNGTVDLTVWGGTTPYTYNWNGGTWNSQDLIGLSAGVYNVVITDNKGCTRPGNFTVTQPTLLTSSISGIDIDCYGASTGSVDLVPSGGTPPYTYNWTNSFITVGNTEDLIGVPAEIYSVTITDTKNCTATNTQLLTQPTQLVSSITGINISCFGFSDGSIDVTVNGGVGPYTYAWSNSLGPIGFTTQDLLGIPASSYSVTITDANFCTSISNITLTQPSSPLQASIVPTHVLCFGTNNGSADLSVAGGTPPYNFSWSNSATTEDITNLFAGPYTVLIVDTNACVFSVNTTINQPAQPILATNIITAVTCAGFSNGGIDITPSGGTLPYRYSWQNQNFQLSPTSQDLLNYVSNTYYFLLSDTNGCQFRDTFFIPEPPPLTTVLVPTHINCFGDNTGAIDLTAGGGILPYSFGWNGGAISEDLVNLIFGTYYLTLTDSNGCIKQDSVTLTQPNAPLSSSHTITETSCFSSDDGAIDFTFLGGTLPYQYLWSTGDTTEDIIQQTQGFYSVQITDPKGCTLFDSAQITGPADFVITSIISNVLCFGESTGSIDISVSGGTTPYRYLWRDSNFLLSTLTEDLVNFPSDTFRVVVTDTNGCISTRAFFLPEPDELLDSVSGTHISCYAGNNGTIDLTVWGGLTPYTYSWSNGSTMQDQDSLIAGKYSVMIVDSNGCLKEDSMELIQPDSMIINSVITPVSCEDQGDGAIALTVTGANGGYSYNWLHGAIGNPINQLFGGPYSVTVTDILGCIGVSQEIVPIDPARCLNIPSSFSPNQDGVNDNWVLRNIHLYKDCSVKIFNQWGTVVHESVGYLKDWDGLFKGEALPAHTYYYIIILNDRIPPYTGPVTIVR